MATKKTRTALLLGSYGQTNLGDDLLMYNYLILLQNAGFTNIIANASDPDLVPENLRQNLEIVPTNRTSFLSWVKILRRSNIVMYGGGTIFKELYLSTGRGRYDVILKMAAFNILAKLLGLVIIHCNIGIGVLNTRFGHILTKVSLKLSSFTIFRDRESYQFAKTQLHIADRHICLDDDGVFLNKTWLAPRHSKPTLDRLTIGLNFLSDIPDTINREKYLSETVRFLDYLQSQGHHLVFFPFQHAYNKNNDREFFLNNILTRLKNKNVSTLESIPLEKLVGNFHNIDLFIGMRFHSLLLSVSTNTPFLAINYDVKCRRLMETLDYAYSLNLDELECNSLVSTFHCLCDNYTSVQKSLGEMANIFYNKKRPCLHELLYTLEN